MRSRGTRYRIPRRSKKARAAFHAQRSLTARQWRLLGRMLVMRPLGWRGVRHGNAHVAMGDTTTLRSRERATRRDEVRHA